MTERSVQEQAAFDALNQKIRSAGNRRRLTAAAPPAIPSLSPAPHPEPRPAPSLNDYIRGRAGRLIVTTETTTEDPR